MYASVGPAGSRMHHYTFSFDVTQLSSDADDEQENMRSLLSDRLVSTERGIQTLSMSHPAQSFGEACTITGMTAHYSNKTRWHFGIDKTFNP